MVRPRLTLITLLALSLLAAPDGATGQRLLEWPVRMSAADALARGAGAVFANPAGSALRTSGRFEVLVMDIDGPDASGLGGMAAAGSAALGSALSLAAGYAHVSVDGIPRTTTSPTADPLDPSIDVSEDRFLLAAAYALRGAAHVGLSGETARSSAGTATRRWTAVRAGAVAELSTPVAARLAASLEVSSDGVAWTGGVEGGVPLGDSPFRAGAAWGATLGAADSRDVQRIAGTLEYGDRLQLAAGASGRPGSDGTRWEPSVAASLRLGRYQMGVVRDALAGGFGAAYWYRLSAVF